MIERTGPETTIRVGARGLWTQTTLEAIYRDGTVLARLATNSLVPLAEADLALASERVTEALDALAAGAIRVTVVLREAHPRETFDVWRVVQPGDVAYFIPDYHFDTPRITETRIVAQAEASGAVSIRRSGTRPVYDGTQIFLTRQAAFDALYRRARTVVVDAARVLAKEEKRFADVLAFGAAHDLTPSPLAEPV